MLGRVVIVLASVAAMCWCQAERRAPQMGFVGMRGKKDVDLISEDKRANQMGFVGMRGKKEDDFLDKRAQQMGFMGMRGKKDQDYVWYMEDDKRAAPAGFFGMRGKKSPSGFFGMRGKKGPSGFFGMRGKKGPSGFLGVRGKKDGASDDVEALYQLIQQQSAPHQDLDDLLDLRLRQSYAQQLQSEI